MRITRGFVLFVFLSVLASCSSVLIEGEVIEKWDREAEEIHATWITEGGEDQEATLTPFSISEAPECFIKILDRKRNIELTLKVDQEIYKRIEIGDTIEWSDGIESRGLLVIRRQQND